MFINRKEELAFLKNSYVKVKKEAQFLVLYGKRRVGKTSLINHFSQKKDHVYYLATKGSSKEQLKTAQKIFANWMKIDYLAKIDFDNWRDFFDFLGEKLKSKKKPSIIVFDEFPYLVNSNEAISSYFQYFWDTYLKDLPIMLVLMGSSIAMMYKHALVYSAPLNGRRSGQWLLEPFDFKNSRKFFKKADFIKTFSLYALVGGIPAYLSQLNVYLSLKQNLEKFFLSQGSFLAVEPELLLAEEFEEPRTYLSILKAIGLGQTKYGEIINLTGLDKNQLPFYLKNLIDLRLIKKEIPVNEKIPEKSKKGAYSISDFFLRFYFSYIYPNQSAIESRPAKEVIVKNEAILQKLIAKAYEDTTQEFIQKAIQKKVLPDFYQFGRWWNKNTEIDLIGLNEDTNSILFVETKWSNQKTDKRILKKLQAKAGLVKWGDKNRKEYFALLSKSGFKKEIIDLAKKNPNLVLIEKDEVIK
jgi:hypothetical protein